MPDIIDDAQVVVEEGLQRELRRVRKELSGGGAARVCECCGEKIPAARRKALPNCRRCVECQQLHERECRGKVGK